jgi:hypothetical protein
MLLMVAGAAVVGVALVWVVLRRGGHDDGRPSKVPPLPTEPPPAADPVEPRPLWEHESASLSDASAALPAEELPGALVGVGGPLMGQMFTIGTKPMSIGSGARCQVRLEASVDGAEIPSEYARVWVRDGRLMLHEVKHLTEYGAAGGRWEILAPHEMFSVGPYTFQFELTKDGKVTIPTASANAKVPLTAFARPVAPSEPDVAKAESPGAAPAAPAPPPETVSPAVRPEPGTPATPFEEPPSILRDRPADPTPGGAPHRPNIFSDVPPETAGTSSDVPNILRDRATQGPQGEPEQEDAAPSPNGHIDQSY